MKLEQCWIEGSSSALCFRGAGCHLGRCSSRGPPRTGARLQQGNQCHCIFSWHRSWKTLAKRSLCTGGDWVWEEVVLGCLKIAWEVIVELCGHKPKSPHARLLYSPLCCKSYVIISEWCWVWGVLRLSRDTEFPASSMGLKGYIPSSDPENLFLSGLPKIAILG